MIEIEGGRKNSPKTTFFALYRLSGLENSLLGLSSRVNAVLWSRSSPDIENIDVICFGHLLFEMCAGYELSEPVPSRAHLELDLERYPQVIESVRVLNYKLMRNLFISQFTLGCGSPTNDI